MRYEELIAPLSATQKRRFDSAMRLLIDELSTLELSDGTMANSVSTQNAETCCIPNSIVTNDEGALAADALSQDDLQQRVNGEGSGQR